MTSITLGWSEVRQAADVAVSRQIQNLQNQRPDAHGAERGNGWEYHIVGAIGELAVARYFGTYWNGNIGNLDAADVGSVEVRTRTETWHSLILHKPEEGDDPNDVFINAVVSEDHLPKVLLPGWTIAGRVQKEEFWKDPAGGRPAYFVPTEELMPLDYMRKNVEFQYEPVT